MPYCPSCTAEYNAQVTRCVECDEELVASLPADPGDAYANLEFYDVYVAADQLEAEIIKSLLEREAVDAAVRDPGLSPLPLSIGDSAEVRFAVADKDRVKAIALIRDAIQDEAISNRGAFID